MNSEILTQAELVKQLMEYVRNSVSTEQILPNFDAGKNYHDFRKQAWEYQKKHSISGLNEKYVHIGEKIYTVLDVEWLLELLPNDYKILRQQKDKFVKIFVENSYNIFEHLQDTANTDYPYIQVPVSRVHQRAYKSEWALLHCHKKGDDLQIIFGCGDPSRSPYSESKNSRDEYSFKAPQNDEYASY